MSASEMWVIRRRKFGGSVWHYGLLLSSGFVVEFSEHGLRFVSTEDFSDGQDVDLVRPVPRNEYLNVQQRLAHIQRNPRPYHLTEWNCEIFANWLAGDANPRSDQVQWTLLIATILGIAWVCTRA